MVLKPRCFGKVTPLASRREELALNAAGGKPLSVSKQALAEKISAAAREMQEADTTLVAENAATAK